MGLEQLIFISGVLHFGTLLASATVPQVLEWKKELSKLDALTRQLIWVHGVFIVLTIIGFGMLTISFPAALASGSPLARGVCLFIGLFWLARLFVQFFVFDAKPYLHGAWLKAGYHVLTLTFTYQVVVMLWAAWLPMRSAVM